MTEPPTADDGPECGDTRGAPAGSGVPGSAERDDRPAEPTGLLVGPPDDPDRYELLGDGIAGGEGITWHGRYRGNLGAPMPFAVKALIPPSDDVAWPTPDDLARWRDHRHLLQSLHSDHLVRVHDIFVGSPPHGAGNAGRAAGTVPYVVMEWVAGPTLAAAVREAPDGLGRRLRLVRDVAEAVATLHSATRTSGNPMLHRDVKPANCIVHPERGAVLVDVGSLRRVADGYDPRGPHTRLYTAPEVLDDPYAPRDVASDLYGVGAVAYFCVVGDDPPAADEPDADATVRRDLAAAARTAGVADVDAFVGHLAAMLDRDPRRRPSRPGTWADELLTLGTARPRRRRGFTLGVVGAVGATAVAVVAAVLTSTPGTGDGAAGRDAVDAFTAFGTSFAPFDTVVDGGRLVIDPPRGPERYNHLWGLHAPGDNCVATVEFDARVVDADLAVAFGYAVAPRSILDGDQPLGHSVQYEWQTAELTSEPGSYLRPAELPGGAWRGTDVPVPAPDIRQPHHIVVRATGTRMEIAVDGRTSAFETPEVECGGVSVRAWGAPVELSGLRVTGS